VKVMQQRADDHNNSFLFRGVFYAVVASAIGSIVLATTPLLHFVLTFPAPRPTDIRSEATATIAMTYYAVLLVTVPAALGGAILAALLKKDLHNNRLSSLWATAKGIVVGVASVSVVILFVGILMEVMVWSKGRGSIQGFLFISTEALLIAAVAGAVVGNRLAAYLKKS
jgi:hypothetical protein